MRSSRSVGCGTDIGEPRGDLLRNDVADQHVVEVRRESFARQQPASHRIPVDGDGRGGEECLRDFVDLTAVLDRLLAQYAARRPATWPTGWATPDAGVELDPPRHHYYGTQPATPAGGPMQTGTTRNGKKRGGVAIRAQEGSLRAPLLQRAEWRSAEALRVHGH